MHAAALEGMQVLGNEYTHPLSTQLSVVQAFLSLQSVDAML
jgi:hypothetical protein